MAKLIRLERRDGVVQRYRTTEARLQKKGYVKSRRKVKGQDVEVWSRQFAREAEAPIVSDAPVEVEPVEAVEPEPTGLYEVVFYTEYRQEGRAGTERYEVRVCIEATAENVEMAALQKVFSILPDDYRDFLDDRLGLFNIGENTGVSSINRVSAYRGVRYYRFFVGTHPGAAKKTFGE